MSAVLHWKNEYSVGVLLFDEHHKQLMQIINELHNVIEQKTPETKIRMIFSKLVEYSQHHFDSEESLMEQYSYPGLSKQRIEHANFVNNLKDYRRRHDEGETNVDVALFEFLRGWMLSHIMHEDKQYTDFFAHKGVE